MKRTETLSFKQIFCSHFRCDPEDYLRRAICSFFYPHAVPVAYTLVALKSPSMRLVLTTLNHLGEAEDLDHVTQILNGYRYQLRLHGPKWMNSFRIRISGRRVLDLFAVLAEEKARLKALKLSEASAAV